MKCVNLPKVTIEGRSVVTKEHGGALVSDHERECDASARLPIEPKASGHRRAAPGRRPAVEPLEVRPP